MSDSRHALVLALSFTGFGYRPSRIPLHQVDFETGILATIGGLAFGLPITCGNLKKPRSGLFSLCLFIFHILLTKFKKPMRYARTSRWLSWVAVKHGKASYVMNSKKDFMKSMKDFSFVISYF